MTPTNLVLAGAVLQPAFPGVDHVRCVEPGRVDVLVGMSSTDLLQGTWPLVRVHAAIC